MVYQYLVLTIKKLLTVPVALDAVGFVKLICGYIVSLKKVWVSFPMFPEESLQYSMNVFDPSLVITLVKLVPDGLIVEFHEPEELEYQQNPEDTSLKV